MKTILISDTHFGVKNNSMTWFKHQCDFIYKQLIPFIQSQKEPVRLYHLGDVFDNRSSINTLIAQQVKKMFNDLCDAVGIGGVYVISGNHDYYSPVDQESNVNTPQLILGEIGNNQPHFHIIDKKVYHNEDFDLLIPWFKYDDVEELAKSIKYWKPTRIFCHADLTHIDPEHKELFKDIAVYSGHIHTPEFYKNLHTIGSTYALTFADCNSDRGFYMLNDNNLLEFYPNNYSIRFWRFKNNEVFDCLTKVKPDDYVELYIDQKLLLADEYVNIVKEISKQIHNINVIPLSEDLTITESVDFDSYNIENICKDSIPRELQQKFEKIVEKSLETT